MNVQDESMTNGLLYEKSCAYKQNTAASRLAINSEIPQGDRDAIGMCLRGRGAYVNRRRDDAFTVEIMRVHVYVLKKADILSKNPSVLK
jgi:hypothetical protein